MNAGARANFTYTKGIHNIKAGISYKQTFLDENDQLGIVNPTCNAPCVNASGNPVTGFQRSIAVRSRGLQPEPCIPEPRELLRPDAPTSLRSLPAATCARWHLLPLRRAHRRQGTRALRAGHHHGQELELQPRDSRRHLQRADARPAQAEPRLGLSYNIHKTNTVLRLSYARTLETPFNENLVLSSTGCFSPVIAALGALHAGAA